MNRRELILLLALLSSLAEISCSTVNSQSEPPSWNQQVEHGRSLVVSYGCTTCHEIPGILGVRGSLGPSLEHVASKYYLAGELPNSSENLRRWIQHPHSVNANTVMPDMRVTDADAADIDLFLETLK
jgi:cytochrome c551/c552